MREMDIEVKDEEVAIQMAYLQSKKNQIQIDIDNLAIQCKNSINLEQDELSSMHSPLMSEKESCLKSPTDVTDDEVNKKVSEL